MTRDRAARDDDQAASPAASSRAMRVPLQYKITIAVTVLIGAACAVLYLYVPARLHRQGMDALDDKAQTIARMTAYSAAPAVLFGDSAEIRQAIASAGEDPDLLLIRIADEDGLPIAVYGGRRPDVAVIEYIAGIEHGGSHIGTVHVALSTTRVEAGLAATRIRFAVSTLGLFLAAVFSAFGLSRLVTRPLAVVAEAAADIARGGALTPVAVTTTDEVGDLATTFNMMIGRLETAYEELRGTNASLEQRVEERTAALQNEVRERRRADVQLRASEQRFRAIFESAGIGIAVLDAEGVIVDANHSLQETLAPHLLRGSRFADLLDATGRDQFRADMRRVISQTGQCTQAELTVKGEHGAVGVPMVCTLSAVRDAGNTPYLIALLKDVTEQRALEERYRQAQKLEGIGRLAGGIAHDFNNLLTTINGITDLLVSASADADLRRDLDEIRRAGGRAAQLTKQLLAFSRRQVMQPQVVQLNDVIAETATMLRRLIGEDIALELDLDPQLPCVLADSGQVAQVIMNLVVNSRDAMPGGGTVEIATGTVDVGVAEAARLDLLSSGGHVLLTVRDNGRGMDAETVRHAFEPFFTTKPVGEGTGLGLATVYGIVRQSGGAITVNSTPGAGTTFRILLPAVAGAAAPPPARAPAPDVAERRSATVLVVEDEPTVRSLITRVLQRRGFRILEGDDGATGLDVARAHGGPIDVLLTDVIMPNMGGVELASVLRSEFDNLRVIYMSGYTPDDFRNVTFGEADVFLEKPMTPDALLRTLDAVLDGGTVGAGD